MLTVHHLETSRSQRILWLLEELGVPYEMKVYRRNPATRLAPPELKAIHPLGKSPVITDGGEVLAESAAIIEYIVETYGSRGQGELAHLLPAPGTPEHRQCRYWMHYCRRLAHELAGDEAGVREHPQPADAVLRQAGRPAICAKVQEQLIDPNLADGHCVHRIAPVPQSLVRRQRHHDGRFPDELSAWRRCFRVPTGAGGPSETGRVPGPHPRPSRVPAR